MLTANLFALMGLRQLYFLIGGLLKKLVYLSIGLAVLLAFIGVKLLLHALHDEQAAVHQRRRERAGARDPDLDVARGHRAHPRHHDGAQPDEDPPRRARRRSAPDPADGSGAGRLGRVLAGAEPQHQRRRGDDEPHARAAGSGSARWPSTISPASAAAAGSRLSRMPNTFADSRRRASSSSE